MNQINGWKKAFTVVASVGFSALGVKLPVSAAILPVAPSEVDDTTATAEPVLMTQACPDGQNRQLFARVRTRDARGTLNIRSRPSTSGAVIGTVPNAWEVVVIERESSGRWARITSHWGDPYPYGFGSAPDFREGWVSSSFLVTLGRLCDKPSNTLSLLQPELFGEQPVMIQDDWLEIADQMAADLDRDVTYR